METGELIWWNARDNSMLDTFLIPKVLIDSLDSLTKTGGTPIMVQVSFNQILE